MELISTVKKGLLAKIYVRGEFNGGKRGIHPLSPPKKKEIYIKKLFQNRFYLIFVKFLPLNKEFSKLLFCLFAHFYGKKVPTNFFQQYAPPPFFKIPGSAMMRVNE